ncbi:hypothetical protein MKJ04_20570 [Pontibacter sp. E15-1]|uniref:hypothetical protein n=1 Tax=Pontibacter sp. E15-1 TaxID=2919918 RepID=UPI001F4FA9B4|nr:hypothetical protein [Pontibacter sp. E15-1]MCJ8167247.1 hypothetical protein [Pontibacter sp. E15-1]
MKIVVLLFASFFSFGLAVQETVRVDAPAQETISYRAPSEAMPEEPMLHVLLDTLEVTVTAPAAVALQ